MRSFIELLSRVPPPLFVISAALAGTLTVSCARNDVNAVTRGSTSSVGSGTPTTSAGVTTSSSSMSTSAGTSSTSTGGGGGDHGPGLYALSNDTNGVQLVHIDETSGVVFDIASLPSLNPIDLQHVLGALDGTTHRYVAAIGLQQVFPNLLAFDVTNGALLSNITLTDGVDGLAAKEGSGSFFCLSSNFDALDPATGNFTKLGDIPPVNFFGPTASNGSDRYYFIAGSDGSDAGEWLFTWDTANGTPNQIVIPQDRKYIGAGFDKTLGKLFVLTFDSGSTPLVHLVSMDTATGAITLVLTLPFTPISTAPEDDIQLDNVTYDSEAHRFYLIVNAATLIRPTFDQLLVIDTVSDQVVSSPSLTSSIGSIHGLVWNP